MSAQSHQSDSRVLDQRTLANDHRRLAELLRPGMHVLDIGCGTGAITAGIAEAVGAAGTVTGLDRDPGLLAQARDRCAHLGWLRFVGGDVLALDAREEFDVVTAARVLQWIEAREEAARRMLAAAKPGGWVVVLDYIHEDNSWEPDPPAEFRRFWRAFLEWRADNGWSNRMGEELADLFGAAGLRGITLRAEDEVAVAGAAGFERAASIWVHVIDSLGGRMVEAGAIASGHRQAAALVYGDWVRTGLRRQRLVLRSMAGQR